MRRNNQVTLDGEIFSFQVGVSEHNVPQVHFQVRTGEQPWESHLAVAYGRLAAEVLIFAEESAQAKLPVEVTLRGWLRSQNGCAEVVASRITFHLPRAVRMRAAERIRALLNGDADASSA